MSPSVLVLSLIHTILVLIGWATVVVVAVVRWADTRRRLREGLVLASIVLILSLPGTILTAFFIDVSGRLPRNLRGVAPYIDAFAGAAGFVFLILGAAHLALKVAVAGMAGPEREPFPLSSARGPRFFAGWPLAVLAGAATGAASAVIFHFLKVKQGSGFDAISQMLPRLKEYSPLGVSLMFMPTYVAVAVVEEVLYRGVLQAWMVRALGAMRARLGVAAAVTSLLWAIAHAGNADPMLPKLAQIFLLGLILGWISYRYSVEASIVAHAALNVTSIAVALLLMGSAALRPAREALPPPIPGTGRELAWGVSFPDAVTNPQLARPMPLLRCP